MKFKPTSDTQVRKDSNTFTYHVLLILDTSGDISQERALIAVGSGVAAVAIVTLLIAIPVLCVFLKRSQKSKERECKRQVYRL